MDGRSVTLRGKLACRCVLVEIGGSLVLIDTGYGLRDVGDPGRRLSKFVLRLMDPEFREELTAVRQVEALGYMPRDVRHIVLTHLDCDHAGGLDDFPEATIHMMTAEAADAVQQRTWLDRQRFRPQQWSSVERWTGYEPDQGEPWFGFEAVRNLRGIPSEILMVPLIGHTLGHAGIAIRQDSGWLLVAGDAYFDRHEIDPVNPRCLPGLRLYQFLMEKNRAARLANQQRLRELVRDHGDAVRVISSHDPSELERDLGHPLDLAPPTIVGVEPLMPAQT